MKQNEFINMKTEELLKAATRRWHSLPPIAKALAMHLEDLHDMKKALMVEVIKERSNGENARGEGQRRSQEGA